MADPDFPSNLSWRMVTCLSHGWSNSTYKIHTPTGTVNAARVTSVIRSVLASPELERRRLR
ncbi:MAG: hypothetical protein M0Z46_10680 [Actinomycetota bacterium]|nr:hypothetical protein [Actinomycetota bacterium]